MISAQKSTFCLLKTEFKAKKLFARMQLHNSIFILFNPIAIFFQVALDKGCSEGTGAVTVHIYRKDDLEFKNRITFFRVELGEIWILYPDLQEGEVLYGKAKRMFLAKLFLFLKRQDRWLDKDGQDRDPHACLKKSDYCRVCPDRALYNGSKIGENHRILPVGQECRVCEKYPPKVPAVDC